MTARRLITDAQRRARIGARHRLASADQSDDVSLLASSLVALHSSDPATVYLSALARMREPSIDATSAALYDDRSLVRHHAMRRTLWVSTPEVMRDLHGACTIAVAADEWQRLRKWVVATGIDAPDRWIAQQRELTLSAVHRLGPVSARRLGKTEPALTTPLTVTGADAVPQSAHTRLLLNLGFDGDIVRTRPTGTWLGSEYEWCTMADWLPDGVHGCERRAAQMALTHRYLTAFGPATSGDVQWWTGWTMGATRAALAAIDAVEVQLESGEVAYLAPDDTADPSPEPWVALLPALDPTAMGWKQRGWYFGELGAFGGPLFDRNGNAGPTVWVDGQVVGGWAQRTDGSVVHRLLKPVDAAAQREIDTRADALSALIGNARVKPRFPTPLQRELAS